MAKPIKDFLEKFLSGNEYLKGFLEELKKGGVKEIFTGDALHNMVHKLAAILIAIKTAKGLSDDEVAEEASEWLDKKIALPFPLEFADGIIFKAFIKSAMKYIEKEGSEDTDTQNLIADAIEAIKAGDIEVV